MFNLQNMQFIHDLRDCTQLNRYSSIFNITARGPTPWQNAGSAIIYTSSVSQACYLAE